MVRLRGPDGFRCLACAHQKAWPARRRLFECAACGRQTSVTAGRIFQDTHSPLTVWLRAMWAVTTQKNGTSALALQQVLGLGSYQTAWTWLHKLRRAMVRPGRDRLAGYVEVDETFIGGIGDGISGRGVKKKALSVVAVGLRLGRIRLRRVPDASASSLQGFIDDVVEPGRQVHTDGWLGYERVQAHGYRHRITYLSEHPAPADELRPRVHLVASLLKRWLLGTHQGAVSPAHLDYYLDEFTFRFNRRRSRYRGYAVLPLGCAGRACAIRGHGQRRRTGPSARPQDVGAT